MQPVWMSSRERLRPAGLELTGHRRSDEVLMGQGVLSTTAAAGWRPATSATPCHSCNMPSKANAPKPGHALPRRPASTHPATAPWRVHYSLVVEARAASGAVLVPPKQLLAQALVHGAHVHKVAVPASAARPLLVLPARRLAEVGHGRELHHDGFAGVVPTSEALQRARSALLVPIGTKGRRVSGWRRRRQSCGARRSRTGK